MMLATRVDGGAGDDTIYAGVGFDQIDGGGGANTMRYDINPIPSIEGDSAQGAPTEFQNLVATIQADANGLPQTIVQFNDQFGQVTQTLTNIEHFILNPHAPKRRFQAPLTLFAKPPTALLVIQNAAGSASNIHNPIGGDGNFELAAPAQRASNSDGVIDTLVFIAICLFGPREVLK